MKYASVCSGVEAASLAWMPLGWKAAWFSEIEPFPCAVLKERFPDVPNLGDMTKIKVETLSNGDQKFTGADGAIITVSGGVDLLVGGTPCFAAGAMVLTPEGYKPIESLKIGDKVVSHLGNICKITAVGNKTANIGTVKVLGRPEITCTEEHPFYSVRVKRDCRRGSNTYSQVINDGDFDFCAVKDSVGRYAGRVLPVPAETKIPNGVYNATDEDIIELAGWYVGDGYIRRWTEKNKKAVVIALVNPLKIDLFKKRFSGRVNFSIGKDGKVSITNTQLADWLRENFGEHADGKHIPYWLYSHPLKKRFISGYEITDGAITNGGMKITTVSAALAYGIADLYGDASIFFTERPKTHLIRGRNISQKDTFTVCKTYNTNRHTKLINGRYASKIRRWNNGDGAVGTVFNITVQGDNSYIVNGLAVHNCQGFSVAGKQDGLQDDRSVLCLTYIDLLKTMRPRWFVWENVPGVFSTNGGDDFRQFLAKIDEVGYSVAWRVLDAQYVRVDGFPRAVPQRRRRVFVVGHIGDWRYPASVLFEPDCLSGNTPPRRIKGKGLAGDTQDRAGKTGRIWDGTGVNPTLNQSSCQSGIIGTSNQELFCQNANGLVMQTSNGEDVADTLDASYYKGVGARNGNERTVLCAGFNGYAGAKASLAFEEEKAPTLLAKGAGGGCTAQVVIAKEVTETLTRETE